MPANPLSTDDFGGELYNLAMSEGARPLLEQVKSFIKNEVEPIQEEFFRLGATREDRWSYAPGQLELLEGVKNKAKANGLWNFFLPDAETGQPVGRLSMSRQDSGGTVVLAFLAGAIAGAAVALLFAPAPGEEGGPTPRRLGCT